MNLINNYFQLVLWSFVGLNLFLMLSGATANFWHKLSILGLLTACTEGIVKVLLVIFLFFILYKGEPTK